MKKKSKKTIIEELVEELKVQDIELEKIFQRRKEISNLCYELDIYQVVEDLLYSDKKSHYNL